MTKKTRNSRAYCTKNHGKICAKHILNITPTTTVAVPCNYQIEISSITDKITTSHKSESNSGTSSTSAVEFNTNKSLSTTNKSSSTNSTKKTGQEKLRRQQEIAELFVNDLNFPPRSLWNGRGSTISQLEQSTWTPTATQL